MTTEVMSTTINSNGIPGQWSCSALTYGPLWAIGKYAGNDDNDDDDDGGGCDADDNGDDDGCTADGNDDDENDDITVQSQAVGNDSGAL